MDGWLGGIFIIVSLFLFGFFFDNIFFFYKGVYISIFGLYV